jgi:hypothetical protein
VTELYLEYHRAAAERDPDAGIPDSGPIEHVVVTQVAVDAWTAEPAPNSAISSPKCE